MLRLFYKASPYFYVNILKRGTRMTNLVNSDDLLVANNINDTNYAFLAHAGFYKLSHIVKVPGKEYNPNEWSAEALKNTQTAFINKFVVDSNWNDIINHDKSDATEVQLIDNLLTNLIWSRSHRNKLLAIKDNPDVCENTDTDKYKYMVFGHCMTNLANKKGHSLIDTYRKDDLECTKHTKGCIAFACMNGNTKYIFVDTAFCLANDGTKYDKKKKVEILHLNMIKTSEEPEVTQFVIDLASNYWTNYITNLREKPKTQVVENRQDDDEGVTKNFTALSTHGIEEKLRTENTITVDLQYADETGEEYLKTLTFEKEKLQSVTFNETTVEITYKKEPLSFEVKDFTQSAEQLPFINNRFLSTFYKNGDVNHDIELIIEYKPETRKSPSGGQSKRMRLRKLSKTNERVTVDGKKRVVYVGSRGGRYIKRRGKYVSLKAL